MDSRIYKLTKKQLKQVRKNSTEIQNKTADTLIKAKQARGVTWTQIAKDLKVDASYPGWIAEGVCLDTLKRPSLSDAMAKKIAKWIKGQPRKNGMRRAKAKARKS